jgi:hypothetical protein
MCSKKVIFLSFGSVSQKSIATSEEKNSVSEDVKTLTIVTTLNESAPARAPYPSEVPVRPLVEKSSRDCTQMQAAEHRKKVLLVADEPNQTGRLEMLFKLQGIEDCGCCRSQRRRSWNAPGATLWGRDQRHDAHVSIAARWKDRLGLPAIDDTVYRDDEVQHMHDRSSLSAATTLSSASRT